MKGLLFLAAMLIAALMFVPVAQANAIPHQYDEVTLTAAIADADLGGDLLTESAIDDRGVVVEQDVACGLLRGIGRGLRGLGRGVGRALGARGSC